jgi:hypothetical protein
MAVILADRSAVRRVDAERYLRYILICFAATVITVRWFLSMTGYPRLGGGELHIAHVLWGGLLLFAAALAPLVIANRWAADLGAVLAGTGVGLFIDEVGKYITQTNDYFFAPAAPIIYSIFLLLVLFYVRVRRETVQSVRHDLYAAIDTLGQVIDHDLDTRRYRELRRKLIHARDHADDRKRARLAAALLEFVDAERAAFRERPPGRLEWWSERLRMFEARWLTLSRVRWLFVAALMAMGVAAFVDFLVVPWAALYPLDWERAGQLIAQGAEAPGGTRLFLLLARFALGGVVGTLLVLGATLLMFGRIHGGLACGYFGLLLSLTTLNLLVFYFDQFGAVGTALLDFAALIGLVRYRRHLRAAAGPLRRRELRGEWPELERQPVA